jgi:diguanylate cyclase (GGDEF)-like protein
MRKFKRVNDERGHDVGDQVLVEVAARIRDALRASDTIVRWGGEEFLALLRRTEAESLEAVAERVRTAVADAVVKIEGEPDLHITCSAGFCRYPRIRAEDLSWTDVVTMADRALYLAKREGRNTWVGVEYRVGADALATHNADFTDLNDAARRGLVRLKRPTASP